MNKKAEIEAIEGIADTGKINSDVQKVDVKRKMPRWVKTFQNYVSKLYHPKEDVKGKDIDYKA